jgi:hypothetical protein
MQENLYVEKKISLLDIPMQGRILLARYRVTRKLYPSSCSLAR